MPLYFFDTSVVVKNYVQEPGSAWVRQLLSEPSKEVFISLLSLAEVSAAFSICVRKGKLEQRQGRLAYHAFVSDVVRGKYRLVPATLSIVVHAANLAQQHPLKGYDAVQVASGLALDQAIESEDLELIFVSSDQQVLNAAAGEGLMVANPHEHVEENERD